MDYAPRDGESERAAAKRLGVAKTTLRRRRERAQTALSVVVPEAVVDGCCPTCGHSPDADENVNDRMIRDIRRLAAKCEAGGDHRAAVVAHKELRETYAFLQAMLGPVPEAEPIEVAFKFADAGALAAARAAGYEPRSTDGPDPDADAPQEEP